MRPHSPHETPSGVAPVEGPGQQVQVSGLGGLQQLGSVHRGDGGPEAGPDDLRHLLTAAAPLLVQGRQEVTDRLPEDQTRTGLDQHRVRPGPG